MKFMLTLCIFLSLSVSSQASLTRKELNTAFKRFEQLYSPMLSNHELLLFNFNDVPNFDWWDLDTFRASYSYYQNPETNEQKHYVFVFGGLARAEFMTKDGLALIICHELGHGFAGAPYKDSGPSHEGQADYYATGDCLKNYFNMFPDAFDSTKLPLDVISQCAGDSFCLRGLAAIATRQADFLAHDSHQTSLLKTDPFVIDQVNTNDYYYPSSQCRIDTYVAGWFKKSRPKCWYKD